MYHFISSVWSGGTALPEGGCAVSQLRGSPKVTGWSMEDPTQGRRSPWLPLLLSLLQVGLRSALHRAGCCERRCNRNKRNTQVLTWDPGGGRFSKLQSSVCTSGQRTFSLWSLRTRPERYLSTLLTFTPFTRQFSPHEDSAQHHLSPTDSLSRSSGQMHLLIL